ncbi:MAG TPA: substrate-binding domain-containing protein [Mycobacteriales bacterium]|nr:substrate-binding domain-containing protein [Mycobacteriales bacterium]
MRRRSIRDVASLAGVSVGTVSNVLNNPELVAESTRDRVHRAIEDLGFVRNGSARQLRAGKSRSVGAIVLDVANPFFTEVTRGIEDRLREENCLLVLCNSDDSLEKESHYLGVLEEQRVRGVLITPASRDLSRLEHMRRMGTAVVLLDRTSPTPDLCSVGVDDVRGGEIAGQHLLELGHRRIAFLNGPRSIRQCADRRRGLRKAVRGAGLDPDRVIEEITVASLNAEGGEAAIMSAVSASNPPPAIFCVNDLVALGVLRALMRRGIAVPDDVAVVGYDDVEFAAMLSTPLTSVRQPKYRLGQAAAELLLAEADDGDHRHEQRLFQPELVVRESSRQT